LWSSCRRAGSIASYYRDKRSFCGRHLCLELGNPFRIRRGHHGFDLGAPGSELSREVPDPFGIRRGNIVLFARIFAQVIQLATTVFVPFDQLPVAVSNEPARRAPLVAIIGRCNRSLPFGGGYLPVIRLAREGEHTGQLE
jgi:hypothetical protein